MPNLRAQLADIETKLEQAEQQRNWNAARHLTEQRDDLQDQLDATKGY